MMQFIIIGLLEILNLIINIIVTVVLVLLLILVIIDAISKKIKNPFNNELHNLLFLNSNNRCVFNVVLRLFRSTSKNMLVSA